MEFIMKANIKFEADDIDDALNKLCKHYLFLRINDDFVCEISGRKLEFLGKIQVEPSAPE